jgi:RNA polymerase sigma-70 factor (TIGR02943 family)
LSFFGLLRHTLCSLDMNHLPKNKSVSDWVDEFGDGLYSWAYHKTRSEDIAKDLVQETFIAAFESFDKFEGKSSPKSWLFAILRNKISDHYRKSLRNIRFDAGKREADIMNNFFSEDGQWKSGELPRSWDTENASLLDDIEFQEVFQSCLSKLPYHWFCCIQLKYLGEKETAEICAELRLSRANFWQILHRTKLNIRKCLEHHWFTR